MLLFNRDPSWPRIAITLSLMASSTLLFAAKPYSPDVGGDPTSCTISPATSEITPGEAILFKSSASGFKGKKKYTWVLDGGSPASSQDSTVSVTYDAAGNYDVSLQVSGRGSPLCAL